MLGIFEKTRKTVKVLVPKENRPKKQKKTREKIGWTTEDSDNRGSDSAVLTVFLCLVSEL